MNGKKNVANIQIILIKIFMKKISMINILKIEKIK